MENLSAVHEQALRNVADDFRRMVGGKYDMCIHCSHDFETGRGALIITIPVYGEEGQL